jgi:hypothetical protein
VGCWLSEFVPTPSGVAAPRIVTGISFLATFRYHSSRIHNLFACFSFTVDRPQPGLQAGGSRSRSVSQYLLQ